MAARQPAEGINSYSRYNRVIAIRPEVLQKKLDFLDDEIDELQSKKAKAGDPDLPQDIEKAKQLQQAARESYSRGDLEKAWVLTVQAEYCVWHGHFELDTAFKLFGEFGHS